MFQFSIITICKDNLTDLKLTFESISSQSNKNFEWIVIDGDSNDGTKEWLAENQLPDHWISEHDNGIYDAMNKGIKLAHGEYLIFMNSADEIADNNVLEKVENEIIKRNNNTILIYGDSIDIDEVGNQYYRKAKKYNQIKYGMITQHQAMFFNRLLINKYIYENEFKLSADYALICRIIKNRNSHPIKKLEYPICKFKMGGINETKRYKANKEDYKIRKNILKLNRFESFFLFILHFVHTSIKHTFHKSRFAMHKSLKFLILSGL